MEQVTEYSFTSGSEIIMGQNFSELFDNSTAKYKIVNKTAESSNNSNILESSSSVTKEDVSSCGRRQDDKTNKRSVTVDFSKLGAGSMAQADENMLKFALLFGVDRKIVLRMEQGCDDCDDGLFIRKDSISTSFNAVKSRVVEVEIMGHTQITFWSDVNTELHRENSRHKPSRKDDTSSKFIPKESKESVLSSSPVWNKKTRGKASVCTHYPDNSIISGQKIDLPFKCDYCSKLYTSKAGLKYHVEQHRMKENATSDHVADLKPSFEDPSESQFIASQISDHIVGGGAEESHHDISSPSYVLRENLLLDSGFTSKSLSVSKSSLEKNVRYPLGKKVYRLRCGIEERPYICSVCGKGFKSTSNLRTHKLSHLSEKPHKCGVCGKTFIHKVTLEVHYRSHSGEKPYTCKVCNKMFVSANTLRKHERWIHFEERPLKCEQCGKGFSQQSYLDAHLRTHVNIKPYKCNVCGRDYKHPYVLKVHKRMHTEGAAHNCLLCGKVFPRIGDLKAHMPTHTKEKPYCCDVCGKTFAQSTTLNVHKKSHRAERPIYPCKECEKSFAHSSSLYKHISKVHPKDKELKCHICDQTYTNNGHLRSHILGHAEKPTYTCPVCQKNYGRHRELRIHMMTHTGEKPFTCDVCGKGFRRKSQLKTHTFIHDTERHFLCDFCGMKFKQLPSLQGHRKTHSEFKPHTCDICGKGFRVNSKLVRHKTSHFRKQGVTMSVSSLIMQ